ncbi:MAG: pimeloyl-ACP methyl ester esterase BioH [Chromatiaceae bacterium]|nr:pimeloyl-ACP methyl ester esterase BioH [Chromatiaceae bacterium]MCP5313294.1 pimeloyl-ACP methyl ester esterase BioH [Chromatiaceae bacterium]
MKLYRDETGRGPQLVLLHGWGMNAAVWEPLLGELARHYRVTMIELPGHGASPAAPVADLTVWAQACLDAAPARAHWLAWSLGGQVALRAARLAPDRVAGLFLVATTPRFVQQDDWPCAMPAATFHQFADALTDDAHATVLRFLALQVMGDERARETLRILRAELERRPHASPEGLRQGLELLLRNDLRTELSTLPGPVDWVFGARDTLVPSTLRARLPDLCPGGAMHVVAGAGHAPFLSHPADCLALLDAAVRGAGIEVNADG